jgi:hypothetical protein
MPRVRTSLIVAALATGSFAAPAIASNSHTQPKGPPLFSGNPASVAAHNQQVVGNGASVLHCNSPANGGSAGVFVANKNGSHDNNPGQSC